MTSTIHNTPHLAQSKLSCKEVTPSSTPPALQFAPKILEGDLTGMGFSTCHTVNHYFGVPLLVCGTFSFSTALSGGGWSTCAKTPPKTHNPERQKKGTTPDASVTRIYQPSPFLVIPPHPKRQLKLFRQQVTQEAYSQTANKSIVRYSVGSFYPRHPTLAASCVVDYRKVLLSRERKGWRKSRERLDKKDGVA
jgi:hypothetical protein